MPRYRHFHELPAWKTGSRLYNQVLDLFEAHSRLFTTGFRGQLDRAALSVSNNIAEGFDRVTTNELLTFLGYARGSAGEVRSMVLVVKDRHGLLPAKDRLKTIHDTADSCVRQLAAWAAQIESGPVQGKRHLTSQERKLRQARSAADNLRHQFLITLTPDHPLYESKEAREARKKEIGDRR